MKTSVNNFYRKFVFFCILSCLLLFNISACSPSAEEIALQTAQAATETASAWTPTPAPTLTPTPTPEPIIANAGKLIISSGTWGPSPQQSKIGSGAFMLDLTTQQVSKILDENQQLEIVSPDGNEIVYSQGNELYMKNINEDTGALIADNFLGGEMGVIPGGENVFWLEDLNEIAFVGQDMESEIPGIYICNTSGENCRVITETRDRPGSLLGVTDDGIYWEFAYIRNDPEYGEVRSSEGIRYTTLEGKKASPAVYQYSYSFALSNSSNSILYSPGGQGATPIIISNLEDGSKYTLFGNESNDPELREAWSNAGQDDYIDSQAAWSPEGNYIFLDLRIMNFENWEPTFQSQMIFSDQGEKLFTLPEVVSPEFNSIIITWSPDSKYLSLGAIDYIDIWDAENFELANSIYLPQILKNTDITFNEIDKIFWIE